MRILRVIMRRTTVVVHNLIVLGGVVRTRVEAGSYKQLGLEPSVEE